MKLKEFKDHLTKILEKSDTTLHIWDFPDGSLQVWISSHLPHAKVDSIRDWIFDNRPKNIKIALVQHVYTYEAVSDGEVS